MNCPSPSDRKTIILNKKWNLSPSGYWGYFINIMALFFVSLFELIEFISRIRALWFKLSGKEDLNATFVSGETHVHRIEKPELPDVRDKLQKWNRQPSYQPDSFSFSYESRLSRNQMAMTFAMFDGYFIHMAKLVLRDQNQAHTAAMIRKAAGSVIKRASQSKKFSKVFQRLVQFMHDLERSPTENVTRFLQGLAREKLRSDKLWTLKFTQGQIFCQSTPRNVYEGSIAIHDLFLREGAGLDTYFNDGIWRKPNRAFNGAMTLVLVFAWQKCTPSPSCGLVEDEEGGVEQILQLGQDVQFIPFLSYISVRDPYIFKTLLLLDITRNRCNEFVKSNWSEECLERVVWALQNGMSHMDRDMYDALRVNEGKHRLDLTCFSPLALLTFSVSGFFRFIGRNDGAYKVSASPEAALELHGSLPAPTIGDLFRLNLLDSPRPNKYRLKRIPGTNKKFKAVQVGGSIKFVESIERQIFSAEPSQNVV